MPVYGFAIFCWFFWLLILLISTLNITCFIFYFAIDYFFEFVFHLVIFIWVYFVQFAVQSANFLFVDLIILSVHSLSSKFFDSLRSFNFRSSNCFHSDIFISNHCSTLRNVVFSFENLLMLIQIQELLMKRNHCNYHILSNSFMF